MGGKTAAQRSAEELRAIRNRCLRAVGDNNRATLTAQFAKLTTPELRRLRADVRQLSGFIGDELVSDHRMKVGDRDE